MTIQLLMGWEEVVRSHVGFGPSDDVLGVLTVATAHLKEVIYLLSMLLIVLVRSDPLLAAEFSVTYLVVSRNWPIGVDSLLTYSNNADTVVHVAGEHMLI